MLEFRPNHPNVTSYTLQWKQYPQKWNDANQKSIPITDANRHEPKIVTGATDLFPATTYCLRIIPVSGDGDDDDASFEPSPELIVDTDAIGCTPDPKTCCCTCVVQ